MIIINPLSGMKGDKKRAGSVVSEAAKMLYTDSASSQHFYDFDVRITTHAGHATTLAAEAADNNYYGVIACGGDGTVNEIASALCGSDVALGFVPLGSGNGLARHLGIPMTITGALKVIAEDRIINCDYATANGRPFFCTFGVGLDAIVTDRFNRIPGRGLKNYIRTALREYFKYKAETYTIIANGHRITESAMLVAVCNASQYGNNAYIAPEASIKDGLLDITVLHKGNIFEDARAAIDMLSGLVGKTASSTTFRTSNLTIIRTNPGSVHFDGEPADMDREINIQCHHGGLKIFSTAKKSRLHKIMSPEIPFISPMFLTGRDLGYKIANLFYKPRK